MYIHVIYRTIIIALISLVACSVILKVFEKDPSNSFNTYMYMYVESNPVNIDVMV